MWRRVPGRIALLVLGTLLLTGTGLFVTLRLERAHRLATGQEIRKAKELLVERIVDLSAQPLRTLAIDYTRWDDMVAFVEAPTETWAAENIEPALATYDADAIWVLRPDRTVAYAAVAEGREGLRAPPWPAATPAPRLSSDSPLLGFFVDSPLGIVQVFGAPVQPDADLARTSEPQGYLFAGRVWDRTQIERLRNLAEADVALRRASEAPAAEALPADRFLRPLPGLDGTPAAYLDVRVVSPLLDDLDRTARRQFLLLLAAAAGTTVLLVLGLVWWVGRPVHILRRALERNDAAPLDRLRHDRSEFSGFADLLRRYFAQREALEREVQERKVLQEHLQYAAHHDALTGLPNRALLLDRLQVALARAERSGQPLGVMLVDLDGFKPVNDSLGHEAGDTLLRLVAARLLGLLRRSDSTARLGGDEFVLLLPDVGGVPGAATVARRVVDALARPFELGGQTVRIGASVGVALAPTDGAEPEKLLKAADDAMYAAKAAGKGGFAFASAASAEENRRRAELQRQIAECFARGGLAVAYEPVVELATGRIAGARAMVRWNDPGRPAPDAVELRRILADSDLAPEVGDWMLRRACEDLLAWRAKGSAPDVITLPLCARRLRRRDTLDRVRAAVATLDGDARRLELEVAGETAATSVQAAAETLAALRKLGLRTALGEFGAGRACLRLVRDLAPDGLRVAAAVVANLGRDPGVEAMVAALATFAERRGGLRLAAEGVETEEQGRRLRELGCRFASGPGLAAPLTADELAARLRAERPGDGPSAPPR